MPSRRKRNPEYQPLHCSTEHHLWHQGLAMAIYSKASALTALPDGKRRPFSANQTTLAIFFKAHPNAVCNAMNFLRKNGWLLPIPNEEGEYRWVSHKEWVQARIKEEKPSACIERKIAPPLPLEAA